MGAIFDSGFISDPELKMNEERLYRESNSIYEEIAYNYGHGGYTGTLAEHTGQGVIVNTKRIFESKEKAWDWIEENHDDKWQTPMAVPVKGEGWVIGGWCSS
jgi:hypothetical protein